MLIADETRCDLKGSHQSPCIFLYTPVRFKAHRPFADVGHGETPFVAKVISFRTLNPTLRAYALADLINCGIQVISGQDASAVCCCEMFDVKSSF